MTIDEQVDGLIPKVMRIVGMSGGVGLSELLRTALLEVARDQRNVCGESVFAVKGDTNNPWMIDKDRAYSAVMNATLEAK